MKKTEIQRQLLQVSLDKLKLKEERNVLGQYSTPVLLAMDILKHIRGILNNNEKIRFLDPAFGTGVFYSALKETFTDANIETSRGFEIDEHYGRPAIDLWAKTSLDLQIADFTKQIHPKNGKKYNLIICNPPYVRHHHIKEKKQWLQEKAFKEGNIKISGLAGLYCYFIALTHSWMEKNGLAVWLIPSEFMEVNYGKAIKEYLLKEVTLLQIHRFDPKNVQFEDALVTSSIVIFKNDKPTESHKVKFTFGGNLEAPVLERYVGYEVLSKEKKWTRFPLYGKRKKVSSSKLSDYFNIKRGIATGDNKFFILTLEELKRRGLPLSQFRPILPSPRYLSETEIESDKNGFPNTEKRLFVLDSKIQIENIQKTYPKLYDYLKEGIDSNVPERYICRHRKLWYSQESRLESNFYFTYIGRSNNNGKNPFRFVLNYSKAIVTNSYLILYPKPTLEKKIEQNSQLMPNLIEALNKITGKAMIEEGRVYGGGMYKMEPRELSNVRAGEIDSLLFSLS